MDLNKKKKQVPFGNSVFQIMNFIASEESPERIYRKVLLQLDQKEKAMKECYFRRKRREVDIEEIVKKLETAEEGFAKQRLEIDLEEAEFYLEDEIKLIEDCFIEIEAYKSILDKLPDFTREDFERSESEYWKQRLLLSANREVQSTGVVGIGNIEALEKIGLRFHKTEQGKIMFLEAQNEDKIEA